MVLILIISVVILVNVFLYRWIAFDDGTGDFGDHFFAIWAVLFVTLLLGMFPLGIFLMTNNDNPTTTTTHTAGLTKMSSGGYVEINMGDSDEEEYGSIRFTMDGKKMDEDAENVEVKTGAKASVRYETYGFDKEWLTPGSIWQHQDTAYVLTVPDDGIRMSE